MKLFFLTLLCVSSFAFFSGCASWPGITLKLGTTAGPALVIDFSMTQHQHLTNDPPGTTIR